MPSPPLVSIIIRTEGRRPALLARALASALEQSWSALEVIVAEDGGDTLAGTLPYDVRHLPLAKVGRSAAGNAGIQAAKGVFAGFLDDDDWLLPHHVACLAEALATAPAAAAACGLAEEVAVTDRGREAGRRVTGCDAGFSRARLWLGNTLPIQSVLFRRSLFTRLGGFDETLDALEDWDLWLRYSLDGPFIAVPAITSAYTLPADKTSLRARAKTHIPALARVRAKHAATSARFTFAEIAGLEVDFRARLDEMAGARWCLGRLWRRLRSGR